MRRATETWAAAGLIATAAALATVWVFLVPVLQSPDEDAHFDYAISIYAHGGLLRVRDLPATPNPAIHDSNPFTAFLERRTGFDTIRHSGQVKVDVGYGSGPYLAALDRDSPSPTGQHYNPSLVVGYPYAYYALSALWMAGVHIVDPTPMALFFGARLFSVGLLAVALAATFGLLRSLPLSPPRRLAILAVVGLFPLTSFVGSYVQPEVLAWAVTAMALLAATRLARRPDSWGNLAWLAGSLGLLLVTKAHYFPYVAGAAVAAAAIPYLRARARPAAGAVRLLVAAVPAIGLETLDEWVLSVRKVGFATGTDVHATTIGPFLAALHQGPPAALGFLAGGALHTGFDFYVAGGASLTFWGYFGWLNTPLIIGSVPTRLLIAAVTLTVLALTLLRLGSVLLRLVRLARRGRARTALAIAASNPLVNVYLLWTAALFGVTVISENSVGTQGRYWLPVLGGLFLAAVELAPRAIRRPTVRRALSNSLLAGLMAYAVVGAVAALLDVRERYYGHDRTLVPVSWPGSTRSPAGWAASTTCRHPDATLWPTPSRCGSTPRRPTRG